MFFFFDSSNILGYLKGVLFVEKVGEMIVGDKALHNWDQEA